MQAKVTSSQQDIFQNLPVPSALRKMILPAISSQLIVLIYNMADTFLSGRPTTPTWWRAPR